MIVPKRNPEVVWRLEKGIHAMAWDKARKEEDFEDIGVLTLMMKGGIHQLNLVGAEIWTRINGINSLEKISGEVAVLFGWEEEETAACCWGIPEQAPGLHKSILSIRRKYGRCLKTTCNLSTPRR